MIRRHLTALHLALMAADGLSARLGPEVPVAVGMRNWRPFIKDTLAELATAGVTRVIGIPMAPQFSTLSVQKYVDAARAALPDGVRFDAVRADADDLRTCLGKRVVAVTEMAGFHRAAGRAVLGIEIQDHAFLARELRQADLLAGLELQGQRRLAHHTGDVLHFAHGHQRNAAGLAKLPLRPMNSSRSQVIVN